MSETCPWCGAPQVPGPTCPKCGVIYAKAAQIREHGKSTLADEALAPRDEKALAEAAESILAAARATVRDPIREWKYTILAIPLALVAAIFLHAFPLGRFFERTFLTMPVHESGHAVTAWFSGFFAVPMLWKTMTAETRGVLTPVALLALLIFGVIRGRRRKRPGMIAVAVFLILVQVICTLMISARSAQALIVFGGDAGAMVLGTLLMASFFFGKETQLYRGALRWGFLGIGAAAFVDTFSTWWSARSDVDAIPYGEMEGSGLSDPSRLIETYGWTENAMIHRYVGLGMLCLVVLSAIWIWGTLQARENVRLELARRAAILRRSAPSVDGAKTG